MWMNAKPFLGSVKEEIALTLLDHLSASALPDTGLMKFHRNVKILMSVPAFLVYAVGVIVLIQSGATSASVLRDSTPLLMGPDVLMAGVGTASPVS